MDAYCWKVSWFEKNFIKISNFFLSSFRCQGLPACVVNNPCKANQVCEEVQDPDDANQMVASCKCIPGYRKNPDSEQCEKIDPCKTRKTKCGKNYHSQCIPTVTGAEAEGKDPDDSSFCYCEDGFVFSKNIFLL